MWVAEGRLGCSEAQLPRSSWPLQTWQGCHKPACLGLFHPDRAAYRSTRFGTGRDASLPILGEGTEVCCPSEARAAGATAVPQAMPQGPQSAAWFPSGLMAVTHLC